MIENETIRSTFVDDILQVTNDSAHLKDIATGKYLNSNQENLKKFAFTKPSQIIGLTMWDLNCFMAKFWGDKLAIEVDQLERRVQQTGQRALDQRAFLSIDGTVWVHDMVKIPVFNSKDIVSGIFTISKNITNKYNLIKLCKLYKQFYPNNKKVAISKFLEQINILNCFYEMPTESELNILLVRQRNPSSKGISNILNISPRTVEGHLSKLRMKSKIDLPSLISMICVVE